MHVCITLVTKLAFWLFLDNSVNFLQRETVILVVLFIKNRAKLGLFDFLNVTGNIYMYTYVYLDA
jgi:hypothetical protein